MSLERFKYWEALVRDARSVHLKPEVIAALILSDAINGLRKAALDLSESDKQFTRAQLQLCKDLITLLNPRSGEGSK